MPTRRKLSAIAFVDIVGYTQHVHRNEAQALEQRRRFEEKIRAAAAGHHGRVVKMLGDGAMPEFGSAVEAMAFALEVQQPEADGGADMRLPLRIGLHLGDVVEEDGDLYGNAVNVASRLEKVAAPGGICFSRELYHQVRSALPVEASPVPAARLASLPEPMDILEVQTGSPAPPPTSISPPASTVEGGRSTLARLQERAAVLERADERLTEVWAAMRRRITLGSILAGFPLGALAAGLGGGEAAAFWSVFAATPFLTNLATWAVQARIKRTASADEDYVRVLKQCANLGAAPEAVAPALDQALNAYFDMRRIAREPLWVGANVPTSSFLHLATERLLQLLEWTRGLKIIAASLERHSAPDAETLANYRRQCEQIAAAADLFRQAQVKMTRAYAALSADRATSAGTLDQFGEITATFDAVSEVLQAGTLELPAPEYTRSTSAAEPPVQVIRGGGVRPSR